MGRKGQDSKRQEMNVDQGTGLALLLVGLPLMIGGCLLLYYTKVLTLEIIGIVALLAGIAMYSTSTMLGVTALFSGGERSEERGDT